jgi:hypothetical protein
MKMATTIQQSIATTYTNTQNKTSLFSRFINWCEGQEKNRFLWLGLALFAHGGALTPLTLFAVILSGNVIFFWIMTLIAMMMALVTNLAAMPTKYTIPAFMLSIVMDIIIVISCISMGFDITGTYV